MRRLDPVKIEILGMDLLKEEELMKKIACTFSSAKTTCPSVVTDPFEVDSLVLTRERLGCRHEEEKAVSSKRTRAPQKKRLRKRHRIHQDRDTFFGETDSLVLARRRLPHLSRKMRENAKAKDPKVQFESSSRDNSGNHVQPCTSPSKKPGREKLRLIKGSPDTSSIMKGIQDLVISSGPNHGGVNRAA